MSALKTFIRSIPFAALLLTGLAQAQEGGHLTVTTIVQKEIVVEQDNGESEIQLVTADSVVPGEKVVYTITFRNTGAEPAENVVITNPISEALTYVAGSAQGEDLSIEFSADGGKTFGLASDLRIVDNGIERPATTLDYTHVRWVMQTELAVGGEGRASFAAVLE